MNQETPNGFFYVALPEISLDCCKQIRDKTGESIAEIISNALMDYAIKSGVSNATGK